MERWVAVKILHAELLDDPDMVARMQREARAVARLSHPSLVSAFATGTTDEGRPFLVMEYVDGRSLERELTEVSMRPERAIRIARQICGALADAHAAGVIHRDLKPANIMLVQRRCAPDLVKVLDFGIAKLDRDDGVLTRAGAICGTPHYLAPEQANGDPVDPRADLYGVGVLLYRMVTGRVPFGGTSLAAMLGHLHDRPVAPDVDASLAALIMRCLEKDPALRPQSAEELDALLAACEDEQANADTIGLAGVALPPPPPRSRGLAAAFAVVAVFCLAFGGGFALREYDRAGAPLASGAADLPPLAGTPVPELPRPQGEPPRRALVVGEGGYSMRVLLPERMLVGVDYEIVIEAWDPEGEPLATSEMILTLDEPTGSSRGIAAKPTAERGVYRFTRGFASPGSHQLRVFPPAGGTSLRLFFDVVDPHAV
jgi:hypothetical protein